MREKGIEKSADYRQADLAGSNPVGNDPPIGVVEIQPVMVPSMANDRGSRTNVAWLGAMFLVVACGPTVRPQGPPSEPGPVNRTERAVKPVKGGRQVMIGEMCPNGAGGRPAVAPLVMRTVGWIDRAADVQDVIERGAVPRFAVFGVDGKVAGTFDTVGLAEIGLQQNVASGTYVGAMPCTSDAGGGNRTEDPKCGVAVGGCGLAIAEIGRSDDPPPIPTYVTGGICLSGDALAVDIDGDGVIESFPVSGVLDGVRSPTDEWTAAPTAGAACKPTFEVYDIQIAPPAEPGKRVDPKQIVSLHVLGVVDVDGDGRKEIVLSFDFPTVRTVVVYTATGSPTRLELAGEGQPFQR